jgi:hypothetical protein
MKTSVDKDVLKQQQTDFEKSLSSAKKEIARIKRPEPISQPLVQRRNAPNRDEVFDKWSKQGNTLLQASKDWAANRDQLLTNRFDESLNIIKSFDKPLDTPMMKTAPVLETKISFDQPLDLPPVIKPIIVPDDNPFNDVFDDSTGIKAPDVPRDDNPFDDKYAIDDPFDDKYAIDNPFDDKYAIREHDAWSKAYEKEVIKFDQPPQTWDYQNTSNIVEPYDDPFDDKYAIDNPFDDKYAIDNPFDDKYAIDNPFDDKYAIDNPFSDEWASTPDKPGFTWGRPPTVDAAQYWKEGATTPDKAGFTWGRPPTYMDAAQYLKEGATTPAIEEWDRREMERLNADIANAQTQQELVQAEARKRKRIATKKFAGKRLVDKGYEIDLDWMRNNKNRKLNNGEPSGPRPLRTNTRKRFKSIFRMFF